jgi:hypothetical protein
VALGQIANELRFLSGHFPHRLISQNLSRKRDCFLLKEKFNLKKYINPETDPVHWDLLTGLSELAISLRSLQEKIERNEQHVKQQR